MADVQTAEEGKNSFSRYVGALESGDEYLVLGKYIPSLLGDEKVKEIFLSNRSDVCRRFSEEILLKDISSGYSLIHIKVKKSLKPVFISIGLAAILCAVLGLLIFV